MRDWIDKFAYTMLVETREEPTLATQRIGL